MHGKTQLIPANGRDVAATQPKHKATDNMNAEQLKELYGRLLGLFRGNSKLQSEIVWGILSKDERRVAIDTKMLSFFTHDADQYFYKNIRSVTNRDAEINMHLSRVTYLHLNKTWGYKRTQLQIDSSNKPVSSVIHHTNTRWESDAWAFQFPWGSGFNTYNHFDTNQHQGNFVELQKYGSLSEIAVYIINHWVHFHKSLPINSQLLTRIVEIWTNNISNQITTVFTDDTLQLVKEWMYKEHIIDRRSSAQSPLTSECIYSINPKLIGIEGISVLQLISK